MPESDFTIQGWALYNLTVVKKSPLLNYIFNARKESETIYLYYMWGSSQHSKENNQVCQNFFSSVIQALKHVFD